MGDELKHTTDKTVSAGRFYPLGATPRRDGVNFALYSQNAGEVFLLLFDEPEGEPTDIIRLDHRSRYVWHAFVHGLKAGQLYGFKVHGEYNPARGLRFNETKLLIDPHAKALTGKVKNRDNLLLGYDPLSPDRDLLGWEGQRCHRPEMHRGGRPLRLAGRYARLHPARKTGHL